MSEPMTSATIIKGGTMVATGSLAADLIIFQDQTYLWLAIVGSIVSMFGVLYEIFKFDEIQHKFWDVILEVLKGMFLGFVAIPFWYLSLSHGGSSLVNFLFHFEGLKGIENSFWLIISFIMSWYTVPLFNWIVNEIKKLGSRLP